MLDYAATQTLMGLSYGTLKCVYMLIVQPLWLLVKSKAFILH